MSCRGCQFVLDVAILDQHIPWEVILSLEFLVAFKSNFLKFLQTQRQASPLSVTLHSHNSSSLKAGCNTFNRKYHIKLVNVNPDYGLQTTERGENFAKVAKFSDCCESIQNQIQPSCTKIFPSASSLCLFGFVKAIKFIDLSQTRVKNIPYCISDQNDPNLYPVLKQNHLKMILFRAVHIPI